MKYKKLEDLVLAFEGGELSKDYCTLVLDNDSTSMYQYSDSDDTSVKIFDGGNPNQLLREALTILGIPWEEA